MHFKLRSILNYTILGLYIHVICTLQKQHRNESLYIHTDVCLTCKLFLKFDEKICLHSKQNLTRKQSRETISVKKTI